MGVFWGGTDMIYTLTFNPALDYVIKTDSFSLGTAHRTENGQFFCGGKGINVSTVLNELGIKSVALGFVAGFTGTEIENKLNKSGIETDFVPLKKGLSRINIKIRSGVETDINMVGPEIDRLAMKKLNKKLDRIKKGDILVVSGSVPNGLPKNIYETILRRLNKREILFVVDATGGFLTSSLDCHPFLIKPNTDELAEIFGEETDTVEKIKRCAKRLQQKGARNVLVSMGESGSLLLDETGKVHLMGSVGGKAVNTVGAGDSMVAGFIAGYIKSGDYDYALKLGTACGGATALSDGLGSYEKITMLMKILNK